MTSTDKTSDLIINKLTWTQYVELSAANQLCADQFYNITDIFDRFGNLSCSTHGDIESIRTDINSLNTDMGKLSNDISSLSEFGYLTEKTADSKYVPTIISDDFTQCLDKKDYTISCISDAAFDVNTPHLDLSIWNDRAEIVANEKIYGEGSSSMTFTVKEGKSKLSLNNLDISTNNVSANISSTQLYLIDKGNTLDYLISGFITKKDTQISIVDLRDSNELTLLDRCINKISVDGDSITINPPARYDSSESFGRDCILRITCGEQNPDITWNFQCETVEDDDTWEDMTECEAGKTYVYRFTDLGGTNMCASRKIIIQD